MSLVAAPNKTIWAPGNSRTTTAPAIPIPDISSLPTPAPEPPPQFPTLPTESTKGTNFVAGEKISSTCLECNFIDLPLLATLRSRKVYAWLWTNPSNALDYSAECEIWFWRLGNIIGKMPLAEAVSSVVGTVSESRVASCITGGNVMAESMGLFVAQPTGTQLASLILHPQKLLIEADRVTVSSIRFINITSIRVWLGIMSSES
jgi:hypothetical protein